MSGLFSLFPPFFVKFCLLVHERTVHAHVVVLSTLVDTSSLAYSLGGLARDLHLA